MSTDTLPDDVLSAAVRHAGGGIEAFDASRSGGAARIVRVRGAAATVWCKTHRQIRTATQEMRALMLAAQLGLDAPRILERGPLWFVMTHVDGATVQSMSAWRRAGAWLARWHQIAVDGEDPVPLIDAVDARIAGWSRRVRHLNHSTLLAAAAPRPAERSALRAAERVWCHRDFHPRNCMDNGVRCAVLDFEHARPDVAEFDLVKMCAAAPCPRARDAFLSGYDRTVCPHLFTLGERLHAVMTLLWGVQHHDGPTLLEGIEAARRSGIRIDERDFTLPRREDFLVSDEE